MDSVKQLKMPMLFMKIGDKGHLLDTLRTGKIYFGTFERYRQQEDEEAKLLLKAFLNNEKVTAETIDFYRRDALEGLEERYKGNVILKVKGQEIKIDEAFLNFFQNGYKNLYCLYSYFFSEKAISLEIDERMRKFGEHVLIIHKPTVFLEKISEVLKNKCDMDYVEYHKLDRQIYTPFSKREMFSYQSEFRIVTNIIENYIEIGNIEHLAVLIPFDKLRTLIIEITNQS